MEIVDKTKDKKEEQWQLGDKVQTNDGKVGLIQQSKDNFYVIVRTDNKHWGQFDYGLVYDINSYISKLQINNPEFYKVDDNNGNEEWQTGDVLKRKGNNDIGLIVENDIHEYCLINITTNFIFINKYDNIADLQKDNREYWHKVNAKLVIE